LCFWSVWGEKQSLHEKIVQKSSSIKNEFHHQKKRILRNLEFSENVRGTKENVEIKS
jgi:hypothetical protein